MSDQMDVDDQINSKSSNSIVFNKSRVHKSWNILAEHPGMKIDEKFVINLTKSTENINKQVKLSCKVLHFSSEWNFEELLTVLDGVNPKEYPNMLVVVIEGKKFGFLGEKLENCEKIKQSLLKSCKSRSLILQVTSENENTAKFYYKEENSDQFIDIDQQMESFDEIKDFPTLLSSFLDGKIENVDQVTAAWRPIIKSSIALQFLKLFENLFYKLVLEVTKSGTKADSFTVLEAPIEHEGRVLSIEAQQYLLKVFYEEQHDSEPTELIEDTEDSTSDDSSLKSDDESVSVDESSSVLLTAIEHKNTEVIDYLITYWSHLIQQLPFNHQVRISTAAFDTNQLDVLCDLLEIADYPFPQDFEFGDEKGLERLRKIVLDRMEFKTAIKRENFEKIDQHIENNLSLKYVFSIDNETALTQAVKLKKFGVFYYLKSLGFQDEDCKVILNRLDEDEKKKATQQAVKQRRTNVKLALVNVHKSVLLLATRSLIHNRKISKEQEAEFRQKIMNWFQDIHKIAPEMLDVAASCEYLKIIFDFESETVENASLAGPNSLGSMYPISKWMFVGAKLSDKKREQQIKGVLAHELCHYVMRLVYENQEEPYYKDRKDMKEMFEGIVKAIDKWSATKSRDPDDECNGIISSVFTLYSKEEFSLELIVRVVQILTEYADAEDKSKYLQDRYQNLFNFWNNQVVPELLIYFQKNKEVKKLNGFVELLPKILEHKIEVNRSKEIEEMIANKLAIVTTNIPNLLFVNICKIQKEKYGILMDSRNFFTESEKLYNLEVWKAFNQICRDVLELNIFVDCTKRFTKDIGNILINSELNFIFIVSNESQCQELMNIFEKKGIKNARKVEINYNWNDLTEESQKLLLKTKINFQNNSQFTLMDILKVKDTPEIDAVLNMEKDIMLNISEIVDDQLLNLLINNKELSINSTKELDPREKYFEILNQSRQFLKKEKGCDLQSDSNSEQGSNKIPKISQEELFSEAKNKKFILISDIAGNGKSWAMKNFTKILRKQNPTRWVTYVDLKQFIQEFKAQQDEPEFSIFMAEKILKPEHKFELKIFQRLYKDGKVFILFDGFDEIAPDCAEFVSKLAQSFQSNEGNQLWIATRDYFEVDLQQKLQLDVSYGLDEMDNWDGIDMIAKSWTLMDFSHKKEVMSVEDFNKFIDDSSDFDKYSEKAAQIIDEVLINWNCSVGMPQMFKMIADGFKDEENVNGLKESKIYLKFILNLYRRWSDEKGKIRKEASIESQQLEFNFWRFHQYHAIASLFPELVKILFPGYNGSKWPVEEVIACGLMSMKNGIFYFLHETLREYFVADALTKALKNEEVNEKVVEVLVEILTIKKFEVIRIFLNDSIDSTTLEKIKPQMTKFIKMFEMDSFGELFIHNLENLTDFVISILKERDYDIVKEILENDICFIVTFIKNSKMFFKFQDYLCDFLKTEDLKNLITKHEIFKKMIEGHLGIEDFAEFVLKIEGKIGHDFIQKELRNAISKGWIQDDDFQFFFRVPDSKVFIFQKFVEMLEKFISPTEVIKLLKKKNKHGRNILSVCVKKEQEILKTLWTEIENYFTTQNLKQDFKEFVKQQDIYGKNILFINAKCDNIDFCKELWEHLLRTIEDRDELKDFVLQKNQKRINFIHQLVRWNQNLETIKWAFEMLKANLNDSQFQEIIQSRGQHNRNLLQSTALDVLFIEIFEFLWEYLRSFCKSEQEFWEVVNEVDEDGRNILNYATFQSEVETFNFLINKLEEKYSNEEIKKMLKNSDENSSLLYSAASNDHSDVFETVWKAFQKYFDSAEILEVAKQVDKNAENFLFQVRGSETFEFATEELEKIASRDEIRNILSIQNKSNRNILQNAAYIEKSSEFHEVLWKTIRRFFNDSEILFFIKNVDIDGNNLLHNAVNDRNDKKIVQFIWNEIKTFINQKEQIEYLMMKGKDGKNVIEVDKSNYDYYDVDELQKWIESLFNEYGIIL